MTTQTRIQQAGAQIKQYLAHAFPNISITHTDPEEIPHPEATQICDEYQEYYRIRVPPETKHDILETRVDIRNVLHEQLQTMEINSPAPDTQIIATHHPPQHIKKSLIFYAIATL